LTDPGTGRRARWVVIVTALVWATVLGGCSSNPSAAPPSSGPTTSATSGTSTSLPTATTASTVPGCTGANYSLALLGTEGAAGTFEVTFGFRNTSSATCPLGGYPGIQLLGANAVDIPTTTARGGGLSFTDFAPTTVSVGPGQTAYFNMSYSDVPTAGESSCPTTVAIQAIAPNTTNPLIAYAQFQVCDNGTVTVSPVFGKASPEVQTTAPPAA
jgi:hypothetical protein